MTREINNLKELESLTIGDDVKIKYYSYESAIFEERLGEEYSFMKINYPAIWSYRINKKDIQFENGAIKVEKGKSRVYNPYNLCYQEKLRLIQGIK